VTEDFQLLIIEFQFPSRKTAQQDIFKDYKSTTQTSGLVIMPCKLFLVFRCCFY